MAVMIIHFCSTILLLIPLLGLYKDEQTSALGVKEISGNVRNHNFWFYGSADT